MLQCTFEAYEGIRTYATYDNAEKALRRATARIGADETTIHYLIASDPAGRFFPVVLPTADQIQLGVCFAGHGVVALRRR